VERHNYLKVIGRLGHGFSLLLYCQNEGERKTMHPATRREENGAPATTFGKHVMSPSLRYDEFVIKIFMMCLLLK
jgi:hypothetical protein